MLDTVSVQALDNSLQGNNLLLLIGMVVLMVGLAFIAAVMVVRSMNSLAQDCVDTLGDAVERADAMPTSAEWGARNR